MQSETASNGKKRFEFANLKMDKAWVENLNSELKLLEEECSFSDNLMIRWLMSKVNDEHYEATKALVNENIKKYLISKCGLEKANECFL